MTKKTIKKTSVQKNADLKKVLDAVLDGVITKKQKHAFSLIPKSKNKEIKVFLTSESVFSEIKLSLPNKVISEIKIKWQDIKNGDEVSLVIDKDDKKKYIALMIRRIIVID